MTSKVNIFNSGARITRFGNAKNAVPFAVGKMLNARGVDCHSGVCLPGEER